MPSIAIVMATFNGEKWLGDQLQSIALQTRLPERVVISDDGSTDGTVKIAEEFARKAPCEVILLTGPQMGNCGENFWFAAQHAGTDLIAWCDQDDYWYPDKLQLCERLIIENDVQLVSHSASITDGSLTTTGRFFPHYRRTRMLEPLAGDPWWIAPGFTTVFRADLLQLVRWNERPLAHFREGDWRFYHHDGAISLLAFATGRRIEVKDALASYRQHERNYVGVPNTNNLLGQIKFALRVDSTHFAEQAAMTERCGSFIAACDPQNSQAIDYFNRLESRYIRRFKIHQSRNRLTGTYNLLIALTKGDYGTKSRGQFGGLAFARDIVALILGTNRSR